MSTPIRISIKRQENVHTASYIEEFEIPYRSNLNVISLLQAIQYNPHNAADERVTPVQWESSCLEEVCGACAMVINGQPRLACSALVDKLEQPILLEPLTSFPLVSDLVVDRSSMFDSLQQIHAWIDSATTTESGPGPMQSPTANSWRYELSKCITCGLCLEACPQVRKSSTFMGPFVAAQAELFNTHPTNASTREERIAALFGEGGLQGCSNAQNCDRVCPKNIPIVETIARANWQATKLMVKKMLRKVSCSSKG